MKKGDALIIAALCIVCILLFIPSFKQSGNLTAVICFDGEVQNEIELSKVEESYTLEVGGCVLKIEKDGVSFVSSDCPDKLCVKKGRLSSAGSVMACVPNRVTVSLRGEKSPIDAIAY